MIDVAYNAVALIGVALIIYVMQKTEQDQINKFDAPSLQWFRRLAFVISALALCYSVISLGWERTLPILALVGAGVLNLGVNAVALHLRNKPPDNSSGDGVFWGVRSRAAEFGHYISRSDVERLDRGQRYTHHLLEAILRDKELEPEAPVIYPEQFHPRQ